MAGETTLTTLAVDVPTELITAEILDALRPTIVIQPLVQPGKLPHGQGLVWQQTKFPTVTAAALTEATDQSPTARTTTLEADITVAGVGVNTRLTDLSRTATVGDAGDIMAWARQAGEAIRQKIDGDLAALFATLNSSSSVGSTGVNMTLANFLEANYTLESNNAPYPYSCVLHPIQKLDLQSALVNTSNAGAVHFNLAELVRNGILPQGTPGTGFWGELCGIPIYTTTECDTANSDADRVGAMFNPKAMAFVQHTPIYTEYERDASLRATEVVSTIVYGVGENDEERGVAIITDA